LPQSKKIFFSMKKTIYIFILLPLFILFIASCNQHRWEQHEGNALGTYFCITYSGEENRELTEKIDSILRKVNDNFSIFDTLSQVSLINHNCTNELTPELASVLTLAQKISSETEGAFDITVAPLINLWGFGKERTINADSVSVDSVQQFVGYNKISYCNGKLYKADPRITLNFNAIAKGWAVDKVSELLVKSGYTDFVIDIGGEVTAQGSRNGKPWRVGIQVPTETADGPITAMKAIELNNAAVATSGNYRNYHEVNGKRYSHILNPTTGYPERSSLLSVTVVAENCTIADAYATAFMVMGREKTRQFLQKHPELSVCFIYDEQGKFQTETINLTFAE
jgi:thiamine biosynthesis lipoprotein